MEKTALVGFAQSNKALAVHSASMEELQRLVETAGGTVEAVFIHRRPTRSPAMLIGAGKAEEIARAVRTAKLDAVIFDADLTPAQQRKLTEAIPAKVIDRTLLILDIFARRARTREGKLQVELAQLNYLLPRVTEKFGRFEQQVGGIGTRGPGERKLEVDRRHLRERIRRIRSAMEHVRVQRSIQRQYRQRIPLPLVAVIGYTNAGKSTLLNALAQDGGPGVYADDKLFATLDSTTRRVKLPGGRIALFADTVGFIQKLPHHLVAAFHGTLEEVSDADLLVHVVDATDARWPAHARVVQEVLVELKADRLPQIVAFNKTDGLPPLTSRILAREGRLLISARTGAGLPALQEQVESILNRSLTEKEILLPHGRRDLLPYFYAAGRVQWEKPAKDGTRIRALLDAKNWGRVEKALKGE